MTAVAAPGRRFARLPLAAASADIPARAFKVLIAICASADKSGRAWPGVTEISRRTGIPRNKIPPLLKLLEAAGLILVLRQRGRGSIYRIIYGAEVSPPEGTVTVPVEGDSESDSDPCELCPQTVQTVPPAGTQLCPEAGTKQTIEQKESRKHTPSHPLGERDAPVDLNVDDPKTPLERHPAEDEASFQEFWAAYPRRKAENEARRAYAKALERGASGAIILLAARRYADEEARKGRGARYIPFPAKWLRDGRWMDEPDPKTFMEELHERAFANGAPYGSAPQPAPPTAADREAEAEERAERRKPQQVANGKERLKKWSRLETPETVAAVQAKLERFDEAQQESFFLEIAGVRVSGVSEVLERFGLASAAAAA